MVAGDTASAEDMDAVIRNFLTKFPKYADNDVYLTAESWGGHYVPTTSLAILSNNDAGSTPYINFKGFFLGNPYTDEYENDYGFVGSLYGHGLVKSHDWNRWRKHCYDNEENIDNDEVCTAIYVRAYLSAYNADVYALDFPQCKRSESWTLKEEHDMFQAPKFIKSSHIHKRAQKRISKLMELSSLLLTANP